MIKSLSHFEAVIGYSRDEIKDAIKFIDNYYYHFEKLRSSGRIRHFYPSECILRDIHNRLVSRVFSNLKFPFYITGSIKGRSNVLNSKIHSGKKFHFKTDFSSYFDFVTCKDVYNSLIEIGFSYKIASIITKLTTYRGHLPQGAPTSPFLANLVGMKIDSQLLKICYSKNITYTRFIDDINLSSTSDFKSELPYIFSVIKSLGLFYNHKKTVYKVGSIEITGVNSTCNGITPITNQLISFEQSILSGFKDGIYGYVNYINKLNNKPMLKPYKKLNPTLIYPVILKIN